jgi:predicted RNA-binding protein with PUA-like domain
MTNYWLFQLNPDVFDIASSDEANRPRRFEVSHRRDQIQAGDKVAIWRSGPDAGVIGFATIAANEAGEPDFYDRVIEPNTGWLRAEDVGRVTLTVNFTDGHWRYVAIPKSILKADPRFEDAAILKNPHARNPFKLTDEQWGVIAGENE